MTCVESNDFVSTTSSYNFDCFEFCMIQLFCSLHKEQLFPFAVLVVLSPPSYTRRRHHFHKNQCSLAETEGLAVIQLTYRYGKIYFHETVSDFVICCFFFFITRLSHCFVTIAWIECLKSRKLYSILLCFKSVFVHFKFHDCSSHKKIRTTF